MLMSSQPSVRRSLVAGEEVDYEAADFVHVLPLVKSRLVVRVPRVAHRIDVQATRHENPANLRRQVLDFRRREGHAVEHVAVTGIEGFGGEGQRLNGRHAGGP